ncbi:hypothetical protein PybrP1_011770 [[Pythium] brassicae (nom. inval.)]|nr:hypothetical protein PybrP1_011770 [[Pythium] brassicae (nom. inval.)]
MDEMEQTEQQRAGEEDEDEQNSGDDDSYANAYLDDDDGDDDDDDDDELTQMLAKVKTIQQAEGLTPSANGALAFAATPKDDSSKDKSDKFSRLDVTVIQATARNSVGATGSRSKGSTPTSHSGSPSPATVTKSGDGIKTISRYPLGSAVGAGPAARIGTLLNVKKPAIYTDKLLQAANSTDLLEKLKSKAYIEKQTRRSCSLLRRTLQKRIEDLSAPAKKSTGRKFATDDEERHCRFKPRTSGQKSASDRDNDDGGSDSRNDFIARMEAAEKSKQKRLEMTRGENEYNARLDKRCCPKCLTPQSYSEYKDKKKRCQMCGVEFRVLQAWGDVGQNFIARMSDATVAKIEKQEQIRAQVIHQETTAHRVAKTARQQFYERQMNQNTFLERNYQPSASSKSKQAQLQIQLQIQTERAKLLAERSGDSPEG